MRNTVIGAIASACVVLIIATVMASKPASKPRAFAQLLISCGGKVEAAAISQDISIGNGLATVVYKGEGVVIAKPDNCWMTILPSKATEEKLNLGYLPKASK